MSFKKALTLILGHKADRYTKHFVQSEGFLNNINSGKTDKKEIKDKINKYFEMG